jgi:glycosyltransferase involved in cell wall biosynthesis
MRVLFLCSGSYVFGAEIVELGIMRGLAARGHMVRCLVNGWNDGDFVRRLHTAGIPHTAAFLGKLTITPRPKYLRWMLDTLGHLPGARRVVRQLLRTFEPEAIVACNRDWLILLGRLLSEYTVVYHVHEAPEVTPKDRLVQWWARRHVTGLIGVSEFVAERLIALGAPEGGVHVIYNGVAGRADGAVTGAVSSDPVRIGICGQIAASKGHEDLLDALSILRRQGLSFRCHVIGRGEPDFVAALRKRAEAGGIGDRLVWRGFVADRDAIYDGLDVVVVPSRFGDPFPTVTLEAALYGLPVVATLRGGLPEQIVDGLTGYLVEAGNPTALAERLRTLLQSSELRRRMGEAARLHVANRFTEERMLDDFETVCRAAQERHHHQGVSA